MSSYQTLMTRCGEFEGKIQYMPHMSLSEVHEAADRENDRQIIPPILSMPGEQVPNELGEILPKGIH